MELSDIRAKIDTVDDQLLNLFLERMRLSEEVASRTYHRQPEGQEQHQEAKPKDQPHREEELRKREGRFRQDRFFPKV